MAYYNKVTDKPMTRKQHIMKDNHEWGLKEDKWHSRDEKSGRGGRPGREEDAGRKYDRYDKGPRQGQGGPRGSSPAVRRGKETFRPAGERPEKKGPAGGYDRYEDKKGPLGAPQDRTSFREEPENLLSGRNPIREALKNGRDLEKLLVAKGELSGSAREIVNMAKENHVPVQVVDRRSLDEITPHHQGMLAFASAYHYAEVEDILNLARERGEAPFVVILDGIQDPHNLGAIIRSAACAGAHGVIIPQRRAVGLTPAAVKASAGAVEKIMVARVTNLKRTLDILKQAGLWLYAADIKGEDYRKVDFSGAVGLVIGSEGEGAARLTLENCDKTVRIPMSGAIDSLNASVAAGILLFTIRSFRAE